MLLRNSRPLVNVKWLGRISYAEALNIQRRLVPEVRDNDNSDTLLLLEHTPVYTIGIRDSSYKKEEENRLRNLGADFFKTDRGGLITYHGPGQLVAYPLLHLKRYVPSGSVKWYVCQLERTLVGACSGIGLTKVHAPGHPLTGVWRESRKLASIGIHVKRYVTSHGVALNCDVDLSWFRHIDACGLGNVEITSISKEINKPFGTVDAIQPFLDSFQTNFQCDLKFENDFKEKLLIGN